MERRRGDDARTSRAARAAWRSFAMDINKRYDGVDLCAAGKLWLGSAVRPTGEIGGSIRIGITRDVHQLFRFYERGSPFVSGSKSLRG